MSYSKHVRIWKTSRRELTLGQTALVMGILNVTPDSFSDGGSFTDIAGAIRHAESMIDAGADIIDVGGESTRPGGVAVATEDEISRTIPVIAALAAKFSTPISIDTTKVEVARAAIEAGAEIVNDISGLRWQPGLADMAAETGAGLVLMHSRGDYETMHSQPPVHDIVAEVAAGLRKSVDVSAERGVCKGQIVLDIGIGFGKTYEQNLELLARLDKIVAELDPYPVLVGTSRKSFIGRALGGAPTSSRLAGSIATAVLAAASGASVIRAHDVAETKDAMRMVAAVKHAAH